MFSDLNYLQITCFFFCYSKAFYFILFYLIQQFGLHIFSLFMMYCTVGVFSTYERLPYLSILSLIHLCFFQGIIGLETEHGTLHIKVSAHDFEMFKIQMLWCCSNDISFPLYFPCFFSNGDFKFDPSQDNYGLISYLNFYWMIISSYFARFDAAFPSLCSTHSFLYSRTVAYAPLCRLPILPCRESRSIMGFRRKPYKKCKIRIHIYVTLQLSMQLC